MDSKVMFAHMFVVHMLCDYDHRKHHYVDTSALCVSSMFDRIKTYQTLLCTFGTKDALETYLRLLVITTCDMRLKQELMEEIRLAM